MADNTQLNPGPGVPVGDVIRTLDRTGTGSPKTEVVQLDLGGPDPNRENLIQGPVPVVIDGTQYDDDGIPYFNPAAPSADIATATLQQQELDAINGPKTTPGAPGSVAVGVASVSVVVANPNRKGLVITNTSTTQVVSLALHGGPAVASAGIVLQPNTGWSMDRYSFTTGPVNAIASAASGAVAFQEFS